MIGFLFRSRNQIIKPWKAPDTDTFSSLNHTSTCLHQDLFDIIHVLLSAEKWHADEMMFGKNPFFSKEKKKKSNGIVPSAQQYICKLVLNSLGYLVCHIANMLSVNLVQYIVDYCVSLSLSSTRKINSPTVSTTSNAKCLTLDQRQTKLSTQ